MKTIAVMFVLLAISAFAGQNTNTPVTSTVSDLNASGVAYSVQSDGVGAYQNGQLGVLSVLQPGGNDWELNTYNSSFTASSGRYASITFDSTNAIQLGNAAYTAPANPPFWGTKLEPVRFISKCGYHNVSVSAIKPGSPQSCPLMIRFGPLTSVSKNTSTYYRLDMVGPNLCKACVNEYETQEVQISCNAANGSGCYDWSIDSIPPTSQSGGVPTNQVVARLVLLSGATETDKGDFYLTFHIHVTNP